MLRIAKISQPRLSCQTKSVVMAATMTMTQSQTHMKREGDISDAFVSLSGTKRSPLPERFLELKRTLIAGHENLVVDSWKRLLDRIRVENDIIAKEGPKIIPSIDFRNLHEDLEKIGPEVRKRGTVVIRNVIPEKEASAYKDEVEEYVRQNPSTRGTSSHDGSPIHYG